MTGQLPFFSLYGEAPRDVDFLYVHVERVSDRGFLHGGHVRPHRHAHLHQLSLWLGGAGTYELEGARLPMPPSALTIVPAGAVHGFDVAPGCDAIVVSLSDGFKETCVGGADARLAPSLGQPRLLPIPEAMRSDFETLFSKLEMEYRQPSWAQGEAIAAYVRLVLILAVRVRAEAEAEGGKGGADALLTRFHHLIEERFRQQWLLADYVRALATTPYLLNAATRAGRGASASALIRQRTITEAKRLLIYTSLRVAEISAALGFSDPTHFSRAFRRDAGQTPQAWREANIAPRPTDGPPQAAA